MTGHYDNQRLEGIEHLKILFPNGEANELNWCLFSTSGVHGLYRTLDDIENGEEVDCSITTLVIMPRVVSMFWGHIEIEKEDITYLRKLANSSLEQIQKTQKGNL